MLSPKHRRNCIISAACNAKCRSLAPTYDAQRPHISDMQHVLHRSSTAKAASSHQLPSLFHSAPAQRDTSETSRQAIRGPTEEAQVTKVKVGYSTTPPQGMQGLSKLLHQQTTIRYTTTARNPPLCQEDHTRFGLML